MMKLALLSVGIVLGYLIGKNHWLAVYTRQDLVYRLENVERLLQENNRLEAARQLRHLLSWINTWW